MRNVNYLFGSTIYSLVLICFIFVPSIRGIISTTFELAFELSCLMFIAYLYPLLLLPKAIIKRDTKFLDSQVKLCASAVVSLGLIGTFLGLTDMITSIAGAMNDSDSTKLIGAIANSLSAMKFAFLTSIAGVTLSLLLMIAFNFFNKAIIGQSKNEINNTFSSRTIMQLAHSNLALVDGISAIDTINNIREDKILEELHVIACLLKEFNSKNVEKIENIRLANESLSKISLSCDKSLNHVSMIIERFNALDNKIELKEKKREQLLKAISEL